MLTREIAATCSPSNGTEPNGKPPSSDGIGGGPGSAAAMPSVRREGRRSSTPDCNAAMITERTAESGGP